MALLSIASYNSNGHGIDRFAYIKDICANHTFILLQEHWLLHSQLDKFNDIPGICYHAVSGMPSNQLLSGRPYGGSAILWSDRFKGKIDPVQFQSLRICGVIVSTSDINILLVSVYMPTDTTTDHNNMDEFNSILQEIVSLSASLDIYNVIIGGDLNTDMSRMSSLHTKALSDFLATNQYSSWINCSVNDIDFTFESKITGTKSLCAIQLT